MPARISLFISALIVALLLAPPASAEEENSPYDNLYAESEQFTFEARVFYWNSELGGTARTDSDLVEGSDVNFVSDVGIPAKNGMVGFEATLKFAERHKLRINRIAITYTAETALESGFTFDGVTYPVGVTTRGELGLSSSVITYDYDIVRNQEGYFALRLGADLVSFRIEIDNGASQTSVSYSLPIPVVGISGRYTFTDEIAVTLDLVGTGYNKSRLIDYSLYLDYSPLRNFGVFGGFRSYRIDIDHQNNKGNIEWSGVLIGAAFRF